MLNNWISDIIVPVLSAAIGAGIGGWIAFLIAKQKFSLENREEGRAGLNTMKFWLEGVSDECKKAADVIKLKPEKESEWVDLLTHINGKHSEVDELLRTMGITKQQWESHQNHILRLAMMDITKKKKVREKCEEVYKEINHLIGDTEIYTKELNELTRGIKYNPDTGFPEESTMNYVCGTDFWTKIANTSNKLNNISNECKRISANINKILIALK